MFGYGNLSTHIQEKNLHRTQSFLLARENTSILHLTGWVSGFPQTYPGTVRFRFRTRIYGGEADILVYTKMPGLDYGDSLQFECRPLKRRGRDRDASADHNYLLSRNACATVRVVPSSLQVLPGHDGHFINRKLFWPVHNVLRQRTTRLLGSRSGIPLALLLGEKGYLDKRIKRSFVDLGISHLLALSGMHLGLVAGAILLILSRLGIHSYLVLWLALTIYVGMVGEVVSLHRAYMMASIMIAARMLQRPIEPVISLGNAVFLIMLWAPWTIRSVGFQLSFSATLAVLICIRRLSWPRDDRIFRRILSYSVSTIVVGIFVQLFLSPLLTLHFGRLSAVSPVATLVFFPFVLVVLFLSFLVSITATLWPAAGEMLAPLLESTVEVFRTCLLTADELSPRLLKFPQLDIVLTGVGIALIWQFGLCRWKFLVGLVFIALSFFRPLHLLHKLLMQ